LFFKDLLLINMNAVQKTVLSVWTIISSILTASFAIAVTNPLANNSLQVPFYVAICEYIILMAVLGIIAFSLHHIWADKNK